MFRYERVNLTRKFTIVAGIVSLIKKICKRDGPLRAVFKVKTLVVLFPPYPHKMKTNTAKCKSAAILSLACFYGNPSALFRKRTHLTAVGLWPVPTPEVRDSRTSRHSAHTQRQVWPIWLVLVSIYCVLQTHSKFKIRMSLDLARGRDPGCWPKGARPLGTRMQGTDFSDLGSSKNKY